MTAENQPLTVTPQAVAPKAKAPEPRAAAAPKATPAKSVGMAAPEVLTALATDIDAHLKGGSQHLADLMARLTQDHGLKLTDKGQFWQARLAGVTATATSGRHGALSNWAMAARRRVLGLEN